MVDFNGKVMSLGDIVNYMRFSNGEEDKGETKMQINLGNTIAGDELFHSILGTVKVNKVDNSKQIVFIEHVDKSMLIEYTIKGFWVLAETDAHPSLFHNLEECIIYFNSLKDVIESKSEVILSPINFEVDLGDGDNLGIVGSDCKRSLYYNDHIEAFLLGSGNEEDFIKCKLVEVDPKDVKIGYTYFLSTNFNGSDDIEYYYKYLGNYKFVCFSEDDEGVVVECNLFDRGGLYQCIPV